MKTNSILFTMAAIAIGAHAVPVQTANLSSQDIPTSTSSIAKGKATATSYLGVPTATDYFAGDVFVSKDSEYATATESATASYTESDSAAVPTGTDDPASDAFVSEEGDSASATDSATPTASESATVTDAAENTESATQSTTEPDATATATARATDSTTTSEPAAEATAAGYDSTYNNNAVIHFRTSERFDGPFCSDAGPSQAIKWCLPRQHRFTHEQIKSELDASGNGQCHNFSGPEYQTKAIEIVKFEPKCKMVAYSAPGCSSGNQWDLGSIGKLSVNEGFKSWKLVCTYL